MGLPRQLRIFAAVLATGLTAVASAQTYELVPRPPAEAGERWSREAGWDSSGHSRATLGTLEVRDRPIDGRTRLRTRVEVLGADLLAYDIDRVDHRRDGKTVDLQLAGRRILVEGAGDERRLRPETGGRLGRDEKRFLERMLGAGGFDFDLESFLRPDRPVALGESWGLSLERFLDEAFDSDAVVELDPQRSVGTARLVSIVDRSGARLGRIDYRVILVPSYIEDVDFETALFELRGSAELPVDEPVRWGRSEATITMLFDGRIKRMGIKTHVQLDLRLRGSESVEPPFDPPSPQ
jgi:hypothetical protein